MLRLRQSDVHVFDDLGVRSDDGVQLTVKFFLFVVVGARLGIPFTYGSTNTNKIDGNAELVIGSSHLIKFLKTQKSLRFVSDGELLSCSYPPPF